MTKSNLEFYQKQNSYLDFIILPAFKNRNFFVIVSVPSDVQKLRIEEPFPGYLGTGWKRLTPTMPLARLFQQCLSHRRHRKKANIVLTPKRSTKGKLSANV